MFRPLWAGTSGLLSMHQDSMVRKCGYRIFLQRFRIVSQASPSSCLWIEAQGSSDLCNVVCNEDVLVGSRAMDETLRCERIGSIFADTLCFIPDFFIG